MSVWQKVKNYYHRAQALASSVFFGFPSKKLMVIGVTGTDGKTTTVNMIYHILKSSDKKVSMVSSVSAQIGQKSYDTGFHVTTPSPWNIQKYLKQAKDSGCEYFVLEATSHGLDQNRLAFVNFKVGVITNITHEHLDYHQTWQNYAKAKSKLFSEVQFSILNKDDKKSFDFLKNNISGKVITYSLKKGSDVNLANFPVKLKISGRHNLSNALAATAVCHALGIDKKIILNALTNFPGVIGRMEELKMGQDFKMIVDFAHTPNGLEQALKTLKSNVKSHPFDKLRSSTLRSSTPRLRLEELRPEGMTLSSPKGQMSKVIVVFGAAGLRDQSKRPIMGKIAGQLADRVVLTAEDPRTEKTEDIMDQIAQGLISQGKKEGKDFFKIANRRQAIEYAITTLAEKGDIVATFGKSHEKSMTYGKKDYPWDEFQAVKEAIRKRLKNGE